MPLVIDCVPFFREQDIWRLRYETLRGVVDGFVVVEARHTHSGQDKALTFAQTFPDLVGDGGPVWYWPVSLPEPGAPGIPATRRREMTQRNHICGAVAQLYIGALDEEADDPDELIPDDAILLISDCDEIPNPAVVAALRERGLDDGDVVTFRQRLCYYDLNTTAGYVWQGTRAARWADVRALSPHVVRYGLGQPDAQYPRHLIAPQGGWHLSYFGGAEAVRTKMTSFLHQELVTPEALAAAEQRIAAGEDAYGRGQQFVREFTDDVPPPVLSDPQRWRHLYHPEYAPTVAGVSPHA